MKKIFAIIALALSFSANALDAMLLPPEKSGAQAVLIEGNFDQNSYKMISELVNVFRDRPLVIYANSPGGFASDLPKIMDVIRSHGRITWITAGICASACAWTALAADHLKGTFYFHGIYNRETGYPVGVANLELSARLIQYGVKAKQEWFGRELVEAKF